MARVFALAAVAIILGSGPGHAQSQADDELFDPARVVRGIDTTREQCAAYESAETGLWIAVDGFRGCMRYYAAGLRPGPNPLAAVWLNGDVLGPKGDDATKRQSGFGPAAMIEQERRLAERHGVPFVFVGRPGTYGSAGKHHAMRGRPVEALAIGATLDALKARYGIQRLALGGHSGGGTLVAEMLARRNDLTCAVISSGAAAFHAYLEHIGVVKPGQPITSFDPIASVDRIPKDPRRRIFVIGDPRETNVPFASQTAYFDRVAALGHAAWLVALPKATDERHHNLVDFGEAATGMCAAGAPTDAILDTLSAMPDQPFRQTN